MALEELRRHMDELSEKTSLQVRVEQEGTQVFVVLTDVCLPPGAYRVVASDALFITDLQYPLSAMDMFWTDPGVVRPDGSISAGADTLEVYLGRQWRRFSWHRNGIWKSNGNPPARSLRVHASTLLTGRTEMNRLSLLHIDCDELNDILRAAAPRESGAFFLLREGRGARGRRLLAVDPMFPPADAWEDQHDNQLRPSARWISSAISKAVSNHAGLLFVHSHPDPHHPVGFSVIDRRSIASLAETIGPILEGPFAAAVVHPEGWAAVVVDDGVLIDIPRIGSIGRNVQLLNAFDSHLPHSDEALDDRQRDALGTVHDLLRQLDVAVVGVGGIGSPIAEELVRMGARSVAIVDDDVLDTPSNVRRVIGSAAADLGATVPPAKVDVVGRHLDQLGLHVSVRRIKGDVRREGVFRELLDTDVVICATDTHGSRAVLNDLASGYMLPVIDVGAQAGAKKNGDLAVLAVEICVLTPVTPCLWCRKRISADVIRAENLPAEQRDRLVREGYLVGGVGLPAPSVIALTTLGAGLATCALLALLSSEGEVCPSGYWIDGMMGDGLETQPLEPEVNCRCRGRIGTGDTQVPSLLPNEQGIVEGGSTTGESQNRRSIAEGSESPVRCAIDGVPQRASSVP